MMMFHRKVSKVQNFKVVVTVKLKIHNQVTVILRHQRKKLERERVGSRM